MATDKGDLSKKSVVDGFAIPQDGETRLWDTKVSGFCLRAYAPSTRAMAGRKVFAVKYRVNGRQRWFTLGELGQPFLPHDSDDEEQTAPLTPFLAAREAQWVIAEARRGNDPQEIRQAPRRGKTVAGLIDLYLEKGPTSKPDKTDRSWKTDKSNLNLHVRPLIGTKPAASVTKDDVAVMVRKITEGATAKVGKAKPRGRSLTRGGKGIAERTYRVARAMFNWAIEGGHFVGENPVQGVKFAKVADREVFLTNAQAKVLLENLDELESSKCLAKKYADIIRLLLLTGARFNEVQALRWSEVDLDRLTLVLPPARTKAGGKTGTRRIYLNSLAAEILREQPRKANAVYVFPAAKGKSGHTVGAAKAWREKVKPVLPVSFRAHDLRHSFASLALADGASLPMIGRALGHASSKSTERYAHLSQDPLREMSERIATNLKGEQ